MADNVAITAGAGTSISTDDVGSGLQVQRVKVQFGVDGSATDVDGAGANGLPVAQQAKTFTGTAAANSTNLVSQDCSSFRYVTFDLSGTYTATTSFQQSNDGTNWVSAQAFGLGSWVSSASGGGTGTYWAPIVARYFRIRTTSYTSGTAQVDGVFLPIAPPVMMDLNISKPLASTVAGNGGTTSDGLSTTAASNPAIGAIAMGHTFNGTTWDRARSLGVTGIAGFTPTPGTTGGWSVSSTTALSTTKVAVKASAGTFGGYMIFNGNTTESHVQVFNVASGSVTLGSTTPTYVLTIPANSAANLELTCGINHSTAITIAATTTATGSTGPTNALQATIFFK